MVSFRELNSFVDSLSSLRQLKYFFISVGCNDLDNYDGEVVFAGIKHTSERLREKFPHIKIVLSEITPRMDERDDQVKSANTLLQQYVEQHENTFLTRNSNMRNRDFFEDAKHFKESCIARFASNIKNSLCRAYGIERHAYRNNMDIPRENYREGTRGSTVDHQLPNNVSRFKENILRSIVLALQNVEC